MVTCENGQNSVLRCAGEKQGSARGSALTYWSSFPIRNPRWDKELRANLGDERRTHESAIGSGNGSGF